MESADGHTGSRLAMALPGSPVGGRLLPDSCDAGLAVYGGVQLALPASWDFASSPPPVIQ